MKREVRGIKRFPTGIAPLDSMLGGGLPTYAVVIVGGEPGTGKTIMTQQMLFANAAEERRGLYLTTLSESPIKAARYQSEFSFFDPERFGEQVVYMDVGEIVRRESLGRAVDIIADELRKRQPSMVVVDSFKAIHDLAPSSRDMRTFVYDLAVELSAVQATTVLVGEYELKDVAEQPEFAVADGIIWLSLDRSPSGVARRYLRILKMRGVSHPTTAASFEISPEGVSLFATPEVLPDPNVSYSAGVVATGVPGLDELLRGGLPAGSPMLVSGESGAGKTTLGLQFLFEGARRGERGIYFSYEEPPEQLVAEAKGFGFDFAPYLKNGTMEIHFTPLPRVNIDEQIVFVRDRLAATGAKRATMDSLTMLLHGIDHADVVRRHVYSITTLVRNAGCTALLDTDPPAGSGLISRFGVEESIMDGVLVLKLLREGRERRRFLEVYKMRGVNHAGGENPMKITGRGMIVFPRMDEVAS